VKKDDLARLHNWFAGYCRSFQTLPDDDRQPYLIKEAHTRRVCGNMARLTESLALDENDRLIAEAVALCHDVGRFPQYRQYRTFRDADSVNHGALGSRMLADERALDHLSLAERTLITQTVALHNVFQLPGQLDDRTLFFVRLVRDADKLDIWRLFIEYYALPEVERAAAVGLGLPDLPGCSAEALACLERGEMVRLVMLRTMTDFKLLQLSWIFDLNFDESFRMLEERDCIGRLAAALPSDPGIDRALRAVREYVERQLAGPRKKTFCRSV
jgi:hypothetical protein